MLTRRRVLIEEGLARSSNKQHLENTDKWHLCKAGSFSYSESLWTPPLEGTSLHRWNNDVERPWGILSLFTTCLRLGMKSPCHLLPHLQNLTLKAVCRTCPQKQLRKRSPAKCWKEEVSFRIFTFCQPYRSPQDESYSHCNFTPGQNNKPSKCKFKKSRKKRKRKKKPTTLETTQSTANIISISIYISLIYN